MIKLDGNWQVRPANDELRRRAIGLDYDDAEWDTLAVPGHWQTEAKFATHQGPLLYRRHYQMLAPASNRRRWITFDGIFYQADVWLDGAYLGDPEGYFTPHSFDITDLSKMGTEHVVAVELSCPPQPRHSPKRTITGVFQNNAGVSPSWNPGGIWRGVAVYDTGAVRIERYRVLCRDVSAVRAHLLLSAKLDSDAARTVTVRTIVDGALARSDERRLARGINEVSWSLDVADPQLWWPAGLGEQPLSTITIEVEVDGELSDQRQRRTGFRSVAWNDWTCSVNGEKLFLIGANLLPPMLAIADATDAQCRRDIEQAAATGLNALRVYGHIARRATYDAADELGILLLQDLPLINEYHRSIRQPAIDQAIAAVDEFGHHPAVVQWSAHSDPAATNRSLPLASSWWRHLSNHQLPSWNRTILDRWVKRALEGADPTRLVSPHSGVLPHLPLLDGTDSHFYFGWYHGQLSDLDQVARYGARAIRFVSEFGAQAVPDTAEFIVSQLEQRSWPNLDWAALQQDYGLDLAIFEQRLPPAEFATFDEWRQATQQYQAQLIKYQVEFLRRHKYAPAGGFCLFSLNEPAPGIGWGVIDSAGRPKLGYRALVQACQPLLVVAAPFPRLVGVGDELTIDVSIVNDHHHRFDDAVVDAKISWPGGQRRWRVGGDIAADSVAQITDLSLLVPDTLGALELSLTLTVEGRQIENQYRAAITVPRFG